MSDEKICTLRRQILVKRDESQGKWGTPTDPPCLASGCEFWNKQHKGCSYRVGTEAQLAQTDYLREIATHLEQLAHASTIDGGR